MPCAFTDPKAVVRCEATQTAMTFDIHTHCRLCWNRLHPPQSLAILPPCANLGEALNTNEQTKAGCKTCGDKLRSCAIHDKCRTEIDRDEIYCCASCPDHELADEPQTFTTDPIRNLLYHMMPIPGRWQRHAAMLKERLYLFNGRKIMAVVTDPGKLDDPRLVTQMLPEFEIIEVPNNPFRREVGTFERLFSNLAASPNEVTLYAQSKGITRGGQTDRWADVLYETMIDYWPHALKLLNRHPIVGSFLKTGRGWTDAESASQWHFSGSWFWFRNADLFAKNWRRIDQFYSGIEAYPSLHFNLNEVGNLFYRGTVEGTNLYDGQFWRKTIEPALAIWKQRRAKPHMQTFKDQYWKWLSRQTSPRVLELGTRAWNGNMPIHYRETILKHCPSAKWTGVDMLAGDGVDVVADAHELSKSFPPNSFDTIYCEATLEHFRRPWIAAAEMAKVIRPGGLAWIESHQTFPIHGYPSDYFRFSDEAMKELFAADVGWNVIGTEYYRPAQILPLAPVDGNWSYQAPAYLNVGALVERLP